MPRSSIESLPDPPPRLRGRRKRACDRVATLIAHSGFFTAVGAFWTYMAFYAWERNSWWETTGFAAMSVVWFGGAIWDLADLFGAFDHDDEEIDAAGFRPPSLDRNKEPVPCVRSLRESLPSSYLSPLFPAESSPRTKAR